MEQLEQVDPATGWSRARPPTAPGVRLITYQGKPLSVATCHQPIDQQLHPDEQALIGEASPHRRIEFTTGRACARAALAMLGAEVGPLMRDDRGAPIWVAAATGSISHTDGLWIAVTGWNRHFHGLGIDAEPASRLPDAVVRLIADKRERVLVQGLSGWETPIAHSRPAPVRNQGGDLQGCICSPSGHPGV